MGQTDLASAVTIDCHTGLCFYGHPRWYNTVLHNAEFAVTSHVHMLCINEATCLYTMHYMQQ